MHPPITDYRWTARYPTFCLTLTRARTPSQVLTAYRVHPAEARILTRQQAISEGLTAQHGSLLRAGTLNDWAFCFEDGEPEGIKPAVLERLSASTETLALFHGADGTNTFHHQADGRTLERFEPGNTTTHRGEHDHFSRTIRTSLRATPDASRVEAALATAASHTGAILDQTLLDGPLLTAFLHDRDRQPITPPGGRPTPPPTRSRVGHRLGPVHPSPPPPPHDL